MSKKLTEKIARKHIGKYIDTEKRLFHYYPLKIIVFKDGSGQIGLKDRIGVCTPIDIDDRNEVYYDYIFKMVEDTRGGEQENG